MYKRDQRKNNTELYFYKTSKKKLLYCRFSRERTMYICEKTLNKIMAINR